MTIDPLTGKATSFRHFTGPRPISALIPAVTRPAFKKQSPAAAQLMADWAAIVGPDLAAATQPHRFASGTLTLGCSGPMALELQHLAGPLMARINAYLGHALVRQLRFVQTGRLPLPAAAAPRRRARLDPVPIEGLPPGPLLDALAALGALVRANAA